MTPLLVGDLGMFPGDRLSSVDVRQMPGASTRPESQRALPPASMRVIAGRRTSAAAD